MNALSYVNHAATSELDVSAVLGEPKRSETRELTAAIEAFYRSRETTCEADRWEADSQVAEAMALANLLNAAVGQAEISFSALQRADLATPEPDFREILADAFADRLTAEAAGVFRAALRGGLV